MLLVVSMLTAMLSPTLVDEPRDTNCSRWTSQGVSP